MPEPTSNPQKDKVVKTFNDHWITLITPILFYITVVGSAAIIYIYSRILLEQGHELLSLTVLTISLIELFAIHHAIFIFLAHWNLSTCYITPTRIINFETMTFTQSDVTITNIHQIHEMEERSHGIISNLLNYGDVHINVSATPQPIIIQNILGPEKFITIVENLKNEREH